MLATVELVEEGVALIIPSLLFMTTLSHLLWAVQDRLYLLFGGDQLEQQEGS